MTTHAALREVLDQRVMVMDGAMGTALQAFKLKKEDFVGERFKDHPKNLQGNNDILSLTRPDVVRAVHRYAPCTPPPAVALRMALMQQQRLPGGRRRHH